MSREIKYRAWDKRQSVMIYDAIVATETHSLLSTTLDLQNQFNYFDGLIWMKCLGLKDKNDTIIYEGDIVMHLGERCEVYYDDSSASFRFGSGYAFQYPDKLEVVGNKYEG